MMKRLSVCIIILCLMVTASSYAMDFIVGAKSGYFVWEPFFKEMKGGGIGDVDKGSGVLYGPVISVLFTPDLTFSTAGLFGKQSTHWFSPNTATTWENQPGTVLDVSGNYTVDIERIDIDNALSYRLSKSFKIFAGYKYQRNLMTMITMERRYPIAGNEHVLYESETKLTLPAHGPALGIGHSLPLGSLFFTSTNLSFVYMWSKFELKDSQARKYDVDAYGDLDYANSTLETRKGGKYDTRQAGLNFEPSLGAMVGDTGVVFNVSARIQYMKIKFVDEWEAAPNGWMTDLFYGMYVSILYAF